MPHNPSKYNRKSLNKPCWCCVTQHAVNQFIKRWEPSISEHEALDKLHTLLNSAKYSENSLRGDPVYRSGLRPEVRMVIVDRNICITVLPEENKISKEEIDLFQENIEIKKEQFNAEIQNLDSKIKILEERISLLKQEKRQFHEEKDRLTTQLLRLDKSLMENPFY